MAAPRIVLIHATPVAMAPIAQAFARDWPEAELTNRLDDGLMRDRDREGLLSEAMIDRFMAFVRQGYAAGADGILATCSAFGAAIERLSAELPVPVLKPNAAMFDAALDHGDRIGMVATFGPAVAGMEAEFREAAAGRSAHLRTMVADGALDRLRAGDATGHDRIVADAAATLGDCDAVMLAQFSMATAIGAVRQRVTMPVLDAPGAAVRRLRALVEAGPC